MLAHVCHPKDRDYLIIIRLSERRFPSGQWKNKDYNRCAAEVLGKKTWRRPVHQKTFVPLGRVSSFCSSNIRNCDDYFDTKRTVLTHFCPVHIAVLTPLPHRRHRVSPLCRAVQTDRRTVLPAPVPALPEHQTPSRDTSILIKPSQFGCLYACCKTFQSSPSTSPELSIERRARRAARPTPGTATRAGTQSPLP